MPPIEEYGFLAYRWLPDGRLLAVVPLTFGRARLTIGRDLSGWYAAW